MLYTSTERCFVALKSQQKWRKTLKLKIEVLKLTAAISMDTFDSYFFAFFW